MILLFNGLFQQQSLHATNVYDAVNDSVEYARDDSSRMSRGSFVINYPKFVNRLNQYQIADLGDTTPHYHIFVLKDNGYIDSNNGEGASVFKHYSKAFDEDHPLWNGKKNANEFIKDNRNITSDQGHQMYVPIRGIQVQVIQHREHSNNPHIVNPSKANGKFIATFVVQESDTDPNTVEGHNLQQDTNDNDRSVNQPDYIHVKKDPNQSQYDANRLAFYKKQQSTADATVPSYPDEDEE